MSLRVLMALHHRLTPGGGAAGPSQCATPGHTASPTPGPTLALGAALCELGCRVDYFGYEHAFGHDSFDSITSRMHFPWRLASYLRRRAADYDVVDVSSGDAWVWGRRGRPGSTSPGSRSPVLISRSDGLEHTTDQWQRSQAKSSEVGRNWNSALYHGRYRLWEVRQSLLCSDHAIMVNDADRDFVLDHFDLSPLQVSVIGHGVGRHFTGLPKPQMLPEKSEIKLVAVGPWSEAKGKRTLLETASILHEQQTAFTLSLLGTGCDEAEVLTQFPPEIRPHIRITPQYRSADLPQLLMAHHLLLMFSRAEHFATILPEAMACGLAPIATRVGAAHRAITPPLNGELMKPGDAKFAALIISRWATDPSLLNGIRLRAQQSAGQQDWNQIASQTLNVHERVLRRKLGANAPRVKPPESLVPRGSIWKRDGTPSLSICICTANRPKVLRRCLASIDQGESIPAEVIVGDDSVDGAETAAVCSDFSFVRYVRAPRRGLCANRNVVIAAAMGDYVALLDDDSEVTPQFVRLAQELAANADGRTIFTGDVLEDGVDRIPPRNPTFWGHFGRPLAVMGQCESVHLNSNIFPRAAFQDAHFDERIVYGYEDMDLCQQMLATGHRIEYRRELVNLHLPPPRTPELRRSLNEQAVRARYYTSLKRYMLWQCRPMRAFVYAVLAPLHQAAHHLMYREMSRALVGFSDMSWAVHQALEFRKASRQHASAEPPANHDQALV